MYVLLFLMTVCLEDQVGDTSCLELVRSKDEGLVMGLENLQEVLHCCFTGSVGASCN